MTAVNTGLPGHSVVTSELQAALDANTSPLELVVLFGSSSRGANPSRPPPRDVDLAVQYLDGTTVRERWQAEESLRRASSERPVDIVDLRAANPLLRFEVARDGVLIWESRPYLWADFRARAMVDWWDWAPYQRRMDRGAVRALREATGGPA